MKKRTLWLAVLSLLATLMLFAACGGNSKHTHVVEIVAGKAATCTETGLTEGQKCSECGETLKAQKIIPAKGHNYKNGVCTICGEKKPSKGLIFTLSYDETYYLISDIGTCTDTEIVIPSSYNGLPVTGIRGDAFAYCSSLTSITIPDSVTGIGNDAFAYCSSLTSITIPDSVTRIWHDAFAYCSSLTSITIPDSVTSIGEYAFSGCSSLQYNEYENGKYLGNKENPYVVLVEAKSPSITSCEIHQDTKVVYSRAFYGCSSLTSITIPESVTSIGDSAFDDCSSLTSVTILDGVTSIGDSAFRDCRSLTSVTIPDSVTSIGWLAFRDCRSLTSVTIPDSVTSIGESAFRDCRSLTSVTIPDSVTSIDWSAFSGCSSLTSITIPDSVTSIGEFAFAIYKSSLTTVYYAGSEEDWAKISILMGNDTLKNATIVYNYQGE